MKPKLISKRKAAYLPIRSMLLTALTSYHTCIHIETHDSWNWTWGTRLEDWDNAINFTTRLIDTSRCKAEHTSKWQRLGGGYYEAKFESGCILLAGTKEARAEIKKSVVKWSKKYQTNPAYRNRQPRYITLRNGPGNMFYLYSKKL